MAVTPLLAIEQLEAHHGLLAAVRGISLDVVEGEVVALVGANGAGKTTLLRTLTGAHRASAGRIWLEGRDVTALAAHERNAAGIALVPEGRRLFGGMTVQENLQLACGRARPGPWTLEAVLEAFPQLKPRFKARSGTLSGGEQQACAIARALLTNPRLLLIDELSLGLSPLAVDRVYASLRTLMQSGTTIVLVEQDLQRAMAVAGRIVCMLEGRVTRTGRSNELTREQVMQSYFGIESDAARAQPFH
jgi:branched-chain amino acid transport system ATP-binding protein